MRTAGTITNLKYKDMTTKTTTTVYELVQDKTWIVFSSWFLNIKEARASMQDAGSDLFIRRTIYKDGRVISRIRFN